MGFRSASQLAAFVPRQAVYWALFRMAPSAPTPHWNTNGCGERYVTTTVFASRATTLWTPSQRSNVDAPVSGSHWY